MSFVYAFKSNNIIYMIGDTKVTIDDRNGIENFKDKRRVVEECGILKTIILSNEIALGFAGPLLITPPCDCEFKYLFLPFDISDRI